MKKFTVSFFWGVTWQVVRIEALAETKEQVVAWLDENYEPQFRSKIGQATETLNFEEEEEVDMPYILQVNEKG